MKGEIIEGDRELSQVLLELDKVCITVNAKRWEEGGKGYVKGDGNKIQSSDSRNYLAVSFSWECNKTNISCRMSIFSVWVQF